jgi:hypothetical protein
VSKVTRSVLKEIVKECMVEIFTESFLGDVDNSLMQENLNRSRQSSTQRNKQRNVKRPSRPQQNNNKSLNARPALDNVSYNQPDVVNENYDKKVDIITNNLTKDPIMAEIFKDTANSTLQQQMSADSMRGPSVLASGDAASLQALNSDPTELFAESASKWATLAFSESVIKR